MRDVFEERLVDALRDLGDTVPAELEPPADLDVRVARTRRRRHNRSRTYVIVAFAATIVIAVGTAALIGTSPTTHVDVSAAGAPLDPSGALKPSVAMLDARGRYVVAIDATGHQVDTLVVANHGSVVDAQLTANRKELWYLSVAGRAGSDCGEVVRADMITGASKIVTRAVSFAVSPDGSRLAVTGKGDLADDHCAPMSSTEDESLRVVDRATDASLVWDATHVSASPDATVQLRWSTDASTVVRQRCSETCSLQSFPIARNLDQQLRPSALSSGDIRNVAVAAEGLFVVDVRGRDHQRVVRLSGSGLHDAHTVLDVDPAELAIREVVPTDDALFLVGTPRDGAPGLYRVDGTKLVHLRDFAWGNVTPVRRIAA